MVSQSLFSSKICSIYDSTPMHLFIHSMNSYCSPTNARPCTRYCVFKYWRRCADLCPHRPQSITRKEKQVNNKWSYIAQDGIKTQQRLWNCGLKVQHVENMQMFKAFPKLLGVSSRGKLSHFKIYSSRILTTYKLSESLIYFEIFRCKCLKATLSHFLTYTNIWKCFYLSSWAHPFA